MVSLILYAALFVATQILPQANPGVLTGRLTSSEGQPVTGVRIIALDTSYPRMNIASQAETDRDGRYRLENVPAGEYFIVADQFNNPSYYPGTGNRDHSRPVSVTAGVSINGLDFKFVRNSGILRVARTPSTGAARFSGVLRDTKRKGIPNIAVSLSDPATNARFWTVTNASGSF